MRVVHPGKVNRIRAAFDCEAFVEQHANAERLQGGNHGDGIVISEHRIDVAVLHFPQARDTLDAGLEIAIHATSIIPG